MCFANSQMKDTSVEACYHNNKKRGLAHSSDKVGCTIHEVNGVHITRHTKKANDTHFEPRDVGCGGLSLGLLF